jgi:hypothetical protein
MKKKRVKKVSLMGTTTRRTWMSDSGTYFKDTGGFRSVKTPFRSGGFK